MAAATARRRRMKRAGVALALAVPTTLTVVGLLANTNQDWVSGSKAVDFATDRVQRLDSGLYTLAADRIGGWGLTERTVSVTDYVPGRKANHYRPREDLVPAEESEGTDTWEAPIDAGHPLSHRHLVALHHGVDEAELGLPMRCMWTTRVWTSSRIYLVYWMGSGVVRPYITARSPVRTGFGREYGFPTGVLPVAFAVNTAVYGAAWYLLLAIPSARRKRRERRGLGGVPVRPRGACAGRGVSGVWRETGGGDGVNGRGRPIVRVAAWFAAGAVINFAVANAIGWWVEIGWPRRSVAHFTVGSDGVEVALSHRLGVTRALLRVYDPTWTDGMRKGRLQLAQSVNEAVSFVDASAVPAWCAAWDEALRLKAREAWRGVGPEQSEAYDVALGWPMRSFVVHTEARRWSGRIPPRLVVHGGIAADPWIQKPPIRYRALAWKPAFPGVLIGAAFWGGLPLLCVSGFQWIHARQRRRAGHCVACGYERGELPRAAVCPECGSDANCSR
ncbi:MAG TPA: hypothetical protein VD971_00315 [Phycisphaerales bacterium]|nr:hypothetical protein [Phycisphaerales bacterium]